MNLVEAWCFADRKSVSMLFTDYRNRAKVAVLTARAGEIMHRNAQTMRKYVIHGNIRPPEFSYTLDGNFGVASSEEWSHQKYKRWWGEHNLMELHDYLMTVHRGWPRKDGRPNQQSTTPSKAEIRAAFNNSTLLYVKGTDGEFVPVFQQPNW